jgi:hypothetical protein
MKTGLLVIVATAILAVPASAQVDAHRSPSMLILPVDAVAPAGSLEMIVTRPEGGTSAVGAAVSFGLLHRVRVVAQAALGRAGAGVPELADTERGWYAGAGVLGIWTLAGDAMTGLDLTVGVQLDRASVDDATRSSAPAGLTARYATRIGAIELQPYAGGGVALRRDNAAAYRAWNSPISAEGGASAGWFAHGGLRIGTHAFWVQPSVTWSKVFGDGGFPPSVVQDGSGAFSSAPPLIERTPILSIRAGFVP